jgi:hypothetical protein
MTKLLDEAVAAARRLPPEAQDDIARTVLGLVADERAPQAIEPDHLAGVLEGLEQARRREFASDEEIEARFRRFGR